LRSASVNFRRCSFAQPSCDYVPGWRKTPLPRFRGGLGDEQ
jgi:hypothetical protein